MTQWPRNRLLAAIVAVACAAPLLGCGDGSGDRRMSDEAAARLATPEHAVTSPSGDFRLELATGQYSGDEGSGEFVRIRIVDRDGDTVHDSSKRFSARFATDALWDDAVDRVWVYSSDVGAFVWDREADGEWAMRTLKPRDVAAADPPPPLLVERRPNVFGPQGRAKARKVADRQRGMTDGPATPPADPRLRP